MRNAYIFRNIGMSLQIKCLKHPGVSYRISYHFQLINIDRVKKNTKSKSSIAKSQTQKCFYDEINN